MTRSRPLTAGLAICAFPAVIGSVGNPCVLRRRRPGVGAAGRRRCLVLTVAGLGLALRGMRQPAASVRLPS